MVAPTWARGAARAGAGSSGFSRRRTRSQRPRRKETGVMIDLALVRAAVAHHLAEGRATIPVRFKKPWDAARGTLLEGWEALRLTLPEIETRFADTVTGCGLVLGAPSAGLADIDLDTDEAIAVADTFLPPTACIFGRASKQRSHRVYVTDPMPT